MNRSRRFFLALSFLFAGAVTAAAQTLSYADAIERLAAACRADLDRHCKGVELGGGRIKECLDANQGAISARCQQTRDYVYDSIARRVAAQRNIVQIRSSDIATYCQGVAPGDANILNCMMAVAPSAIGQACNQTLTDTGWRTERAQQ